MSQNFADFHCELRLTFLGFHISLVALYHYFRTATTACLKRKHVHTFYTYYNKGSNWGSIYCFLCCLTIWKTGKNLFHSYLICALSLPNKMIVSLVLQILHFVIYSVWKYTFAPYSDIVHVWMNTMFYLLWRRSEFWIGNCFLYSHGQLLLFPGD